VAKIKKTKTELKTQREALARYLRFLPTLELKKQQLQTEVRHLEQQLRDKTMQQAAAKRGLRPWVKLLTGHLEPLAALTRVAEIVTTPGNVAGVSVPVIEDVHFHEVQLDLFETPVWYDDAVPVLRSLTRLAIEQAILERQRLLLAEELRITSQRVNLFEKVKIPQTEENIRVINIALGDAQTAAVARAKIAKAKTEALTTGATGA
jgi:V/A-type H+/Na+-transporting ATPase subunit D